MSILPKPAPAGPPRLATAQPMALLYVALLVIMAVAQLFSLKDFIQLLFTMNLPIGQLASASLAPLIITLEVFALPFLLRMTVSPAFRWFSMLCGWAVSGVWLYVTVCLASQGAGVAVSTVGFLGAVGTLTPGWWAVGVSLLFGVLAAWSSAGLWPGAVWKHRA